MTPFPSPAGDPGLEARAEFCRRAAVAAGALARAGFRRRDAAEIGRKGAQDFLTETDAAVEAHLRAAIAAAFPQDAILGEEGGAGGGAGGILWVVDPIDGTANFARGIAHFCVSIAVLRGGVTEIGCIHAPVSGETWLARRGGGCTLDGLAVRVAATDSFAAACLEMGWSNRRPQQDYLDAMARLLTSGANVRRGASGALGLAYVADGRSDGYAELHMNPWDCLAGLLMVAEAGGRTGRVGAAMLTEGGPVLAVVPALAEAVSTATGIALAPARPAAAPGARVPA
ncbi:MAG: inositol monophosphatase [Rhodobacteraceae bacterium]|nr:inositol monophosphatase [Paracoccaceae bacterium]